MRIRLTDDGRMLQGTATQIVQTMRSLALGRETVSLCCDKVQLNGGSSCSIEVPISSSKDSSAKRHQLMPTSQVA